MLRARNSSASQNRTNFAHISKEREIGEEEFGVHGDGFPIFSVDNPRWWWVMHTCNDIYKLETQVQWCAAKSVTADVLRLDESTGHLDVDNIRWLEDWLESFPGSIIGTSHFSPVLDKMCTDIIDFQDRKLKTVKGEKD